MEEEKPPIQIKLMVEPRIRTLIPDHIWRKAWVDCVKLWDADGHNKTRVIVRLHKGWRFVFLWREDMDAMCFMISGSYP